MLSDLGVCMIRQARIRSILGFSITTFSVVIQSYKTLGRQCNGQDFALNMLERAGVRTDYALKCERAYLICVVYDSHSCTLFPSY